MIPFFGRCPVRQYVKNRPRPVGLQNFVVTTRTVPGVEIYQGLTTNLPNRDLGLGPLVVLRLVETLPPESSVFFYRYVTTVPLLNKLTNKLISMVLVLLCRTHLEAVTSRVTKVDKKCKPEEEDERKENTKAETDEREEKKRKTAAP